MYLEGQLTSLVPQPTCCWSPSDVFKVRWGPCLAIWQRVEFNAKLGQVKCIANAPRIVVQMGRLQSWLSLHVWSGTTGGFGFLSFIRHDLPSFFVLSNNFCFICCCVFFVSHFLIIIHLDLPLTRSPLGIRLHHSYTTASKFPNRLLLSS